MRMDLAVTKNLLHEWGNGNSTALNKFVTHMYTDLQHLAKRIMWRERSDHTLSPGALINELYIRLSSRTYKARDRGHFLALAALELRHILISHARRRNANKRIPTSVVTMDEGLARESSQFVGSLALEQALLKLQAMDANARQIVELRILAGLTVSDIAMRLQLNERTVYRRYLWARNWLYKELNT